MRGRRANGLFYGGVGLEGLLHLRFFRAMIVAMLRKASVCTLPVCLFLLCAQLHAQQSVHMRQKIPSPLYGITLDAVSKSSINKIIDAVKTLPVKPTARVIIDADKKPADFVPLLARLHEVSYVLLCPCDSSDMKLYETVESYTARFADCVAHLASYTDIWEVGNEVNGELWQGGTDELIGQKVYAAWKYVHERGLVSALTTYMFKIGDQSMTMEEWLAKFIPSDMKNALDYVLVSYYDEGNEGMHEDWNDMFKNLYEMFPSSQLGFGEVGFAAPHRAGKAFNAQADAYYRMKPYNDRYVGGYFWWYWQEDCVPHKRNSRRQKIADNFLWMKENY